MIGVVLLSGIPPAGERTGISASAILVADPGGLPQDRAGSSSPHGTDVEVAPAFVPSLAVSPAGQAPPETPLEVEVGLAMPNASALAGFLSAVNAPGSPLYHRFLTVGELVQRFGPSPTAVGAAQAYFERFGLSVRASPDHLLLTVSGSSARIGEAFGTSIEVYRGAAGHWFLSHPTPATLPAVAPWSGVYGLGNVTPLVPAVRSTFPPRALVTPSAGCLGTGGLLLPCQIWQAYNMTSLVTTGTNGSGERIAVVDPYSSSEPQPQLASDLALFAAQNSLGANPVNFVYPDTTSRNLNASTNAAWNVEDALDLEWARASAPGATIDMTFSPDAGAGLYDAIDWLVAHQATDVISMSWGEPDVGAFNPYATPCTSACNASTDGSYGILSPVLAFAAAEGISLFAASGDCGSADGTAGISTNYPSSDPDVTGVGGTTLGANMTGVYLSETAWSGNGSGASAPGCVNQGGSGGGYSPFPRPVWQSGLPSGEDFRGVPDVAIDGGTGVTLVLDGLDTGVYGTSLSTVVWAGIAALADQYAGRSLGLLNPSLYAIASGGRYAVDFHDIVGGNNGAYSAGAGWDAVTGIGSPRVDTLVVDLGHGAAVSSSTLRTFLYASPRYGPAPLTVRFHVEPSGGSGAYPLEGVAFDDGTASFASGGYVTHTFTSSGVHAAVAYVADSDANYTASPPIAIVVGGGTRLSVDLSVSSATPARGASVTFSASVAGGVGPYEYRFAFGDGTYLENSSASTAVHSYGVRGSFCAEVTVSDSGVPVNGGASNRVAVGVAGATAPDCANDSIPLVVTPTPGADVRDAPADFSNLAPGLFSVSGGSVSTGGLPPSIEASATDPYVAACGCAIFRSPGVYAVHVNVSDSENEEANASANVTVAPPLVGEFTATKTYGVAPLTVVFRANASGGYEADAASTLWTFGDGRGDVGTSVSATYATPGYYVATGQLSDRGHGNASEAFLIDVQDAGTAPSSPPVYLTANVTPAVAVPLGSSVSLRASLVDENGTPLSSLVRWQLGTSFGGYEPDLNWTYSAPLPSPDNGTLNASVLAVGPIGSSATGPTVSQASFRFAGFSASEPGGFEPRVDALEFLSTGGPAQGTPPLEWNGTGIVQGPGFTSIWWKLETGVAVTGPVAQFAFPAGIYTVVATANDSWGDSATELFPVAALEPLTPGASLSATGGDAPLTVEFRADGSGGLGPQYEYRWSFGDGGAAETADGNHTFASAGKYLVTVNVTDALGDWSRTNWTVTVTVAGSEWVPAIILGVGVTVGAIAALIVTTHRRRTSSGGTASAIPSPRREGPGERPGA
jgi:kumamolisin